MASHATLTIEIFMFQLNLDNPQEVLRITPPEHFQTNIIISYHLLSVTTFCRRSFLSKSVQVGLECNVYDDNIFDSYSRSLVLLRLPCLECVAMYSSHSTFSHTIQVPEDSRDACIRGWVLYGINPPKKKVLQLLATELFLIV